MVGARLRFEALVPLDYPSSMRKSTLFLCLVAASSVVSAEVYRWVDPEGRVHFSDRPAPAAEAVAMPGSPGSGDAADAEAITAAEALLGPYNAFEIVSPEPNENLRVADGNLPLRLIIDPPLDTAHSLELVVDGAPLPLPDRQNQASQLSLSGIALGSHTVEAQIRGADGALIARTATVPFHVRRPLPPGVLE